MVTIDELKRHYLFSDKDAELLTSFLPHAEANKVKLADDLYDYLLGIPETAKFLQDEAVLQRLKKTHQDWFMDLFSGKYDNHYLRKLEKIGLAHVRIGLNAHFVNCAMNFVRQAVTNLIRDTYPDRDTRRRLTDSTEKILDANLDIMSASYLEEELKKEFVSHRLESKLIQATERFTYGLNLILVVALAGVSISVVALFVWDLLHIFRGNIEKGILSALGTLLILWMMIELLGNEIKNLKGGKFNILVFIGVIIIALIREILISTLRHDALETQAFLAGTLLILGIVYFLVARSQHDSLTH
ncbi:MAG: heme-binding sensor globin domain-containing protein [Deltaproteobacteria bacterium]|nr:heme-binding sensor globin domain-containing protein [Deltaproteobacteria bacterium]TLN03877.1 MAG: heme-binding sensor globin domain-containing protein [bacterium]